jgi:hypothetical protein
MAWLVEQRVAPPCVACVEHCYEETVHVVNGRALIQHHSAVLTLHTLGYDVIAEILPPLEELEAHPELCAELATQGLGPWAGKTTEERAALAGAE